MSAVARERRLAGAVALGGAVVVLDTTVTVVAVPVLVRVLDSSLATLQWTTTAYVLALIATLPSSAALAGRFGTRRVYVSALLVFALGSILATVAVGPATLIGARVVQGLGGGLVNPVGMMLALRDVPPERRGRVTSILGLPLLVGVAGPILAGWLIDAWSWRAIFALTAAPTVLGAVLVARWAPPDSPPSRPTDQPARGGDLPGATLLAGATVLVVYAAGASSLPGAVRLVLAGGGLLGAVAFVTRSRRRANPLLRLDLLARHDVAPGVTVLVLFGAAYLGAMLLVPSYLQTTRGVSAGVTGTLLVPAGLATAITLQVATRLVDRVPARRVVGTGLAIAAASQAATALVLRVDTELWVVVALGVVMGVGSGSVLSPAMTTVTRHLDGAELASGSTLMGLAQQLATALGVAAITGLYTALAPDGSSAAELVGAQRITMLLPLALTLTGLTVAVTLLGRTGRASYARHHQDEEARCEPAAS